MIIAYSHSVKVQGVKVVQLRNNENNRCKLEKKNNG